MKRLTIALWFALSIYLTSGAFAANWYVDKNATGSNNGTSWATAWSNFNSIVWGTGGVKAGDTLFISGGSTSKTYAQTLVIGASGASGAPITIRPGQESGHNGKVVITSPTGHGILIGSRDWITIDGEYNGERHIITANNKSTGGKGIHISEKRTYVGIVIKYVESYGNSTSGIEINGSMTQSEVAYCNLHSNGEAGIGKGSGSKTSADGLVIHHSLFSKNGTDCMTTAGGFTYHDNFCSAIDGSHHDGIQCYGGITEGSSPGCSYVKIYNSVFTGAGHANVFIGPGVNSSHIMVYNNVFYCDKTIVPDCSDIGIKVKPASPNMTIDDIKVYNNTLVDQQYSAIVFEGRYGSERVSNIDIRNNLVYRGHRIQLRNFSSISNLAIDNNVIYRRLAGDDNIVVGSATYACNSASYTGYNINGSCRQPLLGKYIEGALGDYRLSVSDTVARDKGDSDMSWLFTADIDGHLRDSVWDIGAYEYGADQLAPEPPKNFRIIAVQ